MACSQITLGSLLLQSNMYYCGVRMLYYELLGQLSLSSWVDKSSKALNGWGKGGNVTTGGWQVTMCDPIWHVSSRIAARRL